MNETNFDQTDSQELKELSLDNEPFYFESDTLALRNNPDYSCLLKTLALLEGQRMKACHDLEQLIDLKDQALKEPLKFINLLTKNELNIPSRQKCYVLPDIDFNKYYDCVDIEDFEAIKNQNTQRSHSLRQSFKMIEKLTKDDTETRRSSRQTSTKQQKPEKEIKNYNKPWTVEEQRQLEEFLLEFPPEDNEAARFRKIANKLGTRTPLQVQSHCQKYFIKLAKAGLPIPGRMPNLKTYVTKKGVRGKCRSTLVRGACLSAARGGGRGIIGNNGRDSTGRKMVGRGVSLNEISSMWTSFNPPITMNDDNELSDYEYDLENSNFENDDEELNENYEDYEELEEEENSQTYEFEEDEENSISHSQLSSSTNSSNLNNFSKK